MDECKQKIALVTGASRGIGRALAKRLAAEGASVVISASKMGEALQGTQEEIEKAGGRVAPLAFDLSDAEARASAIERAAGFFGEIDILINNAAMTDDMTPPSTCDLVTRRRMFEVNYHAPLDLIQQALPSMRKRGAGWILNMTSCTVEQEHLPYRAPGEYVHPLTIYGSTKAALNRTTLGLAHELSGQGIRLNALYPQQVVLTEGAAEAVADDFMQANPDMYEPMELMVEAALALVTGPHTAQIRSSRDLLFTLQRPVRSLDGREIVGDASTRFAPST